jgi:hypothetical protein
MYATATQHSPVLAQVPGQANAALRQEIFSDLLEVLHYDPADRNNLGKAEVLRRSEMRFDLLCQKYEGIAKAFIEYLRNQWRPKLGKMSPTPC